MVLVVALLSALVLIGQSPASQLPVAVTQPSPSPSESPTAQPWDLDADIGAVMVFSWRGSVDWSVVRPLLVNDQIGGVLLFTPNFGGNAADLKSWTDKLQALASSTCLGHPTLVSAAVQGLHDGGVGATVKHFPGLGGAAGDPHVAIPTDPESETQWKAVQMPAFQAGIAAGADAVMVTSVYVPGLGGGSTPAMFSAPVIGKLRRQLGFEGAIVTDSLSMGGIGARWPLPEAAVMALAAGNDMLLLGNGDPNYETDAVSAVRGAVLSGRLDRTKLHESAMRVNALRDRGG